MRWRVDAILVDIVEADTADEATNIVMSKLAGKYGSEFLNDAIIRAQLAVLQDDYHDTEGSYIGNL